MQINNTDRSYHTGKRDTIDLTGSRYDSKTILNSISIDLEQSHSVTPKNKSLSRGVRTINLLNHVCNIPESQRFLIHCHSVRSNCRDQTSGLVGIVITGCLVVNTVNESVLDITVHLLNLSCNLKIQFGNRVRLLIRNVDTGKSTHVALLTVRDTYRLLKNLSHVSFLLTGSNRSVRCSKRLILSNLRLRTVTTGTVFLTCHKLYMIGSFGFRADNRTKRGFNITLVKKHTGVVQDSEASCKYVCHYSFTPLLFCLIGSVLCCQTCIVGNCGQISACLCFFDFLLIVHATSILRTRSRSGSTLHLFGKNIFLTGFKVFSLIRHNLVHVTIYHCCSSVISKFFIIAHSQKFCFLF
nr:MAG TPA: hypothetical protein [Caudoviricetes sp.]